MKDGVGRAIVSDDEVHVKLAVKWVGLIKILCQEGGRCVGCKVKEGCWCKCDGVLEPGIERSAEDDDNVEGQHDQIGEDVKGGGWGELGIESIVFGSGCRWCW